MLTENKLDRYGVVYEHLSELYEKQYKQIFGRLNGVLRVLIFHQTYSELVQMAQAGYLNDYYERIKRNAV